MKDIIERASKIKWNLGNQDFKHYSELMDKLRKRKYTPKEKEQFKKTIDFILEKYER